MSLEEYGLLTGHCDGCKAPVDYCQCHLMSDGTSGALASNVSLTCTPAACPGCTHCEEEE